MSKKHIISRTTAEEMDDDVLVESLYPEIQLDIFEKKEIDSCLYLASTVFNDDVFFEFYRIPIKRFLNNENIIIDELKNNVKTLVLKSL